MIAIIDYGMGNVRSVAGALEYIGEEAVVTDDPSEIAAADRLVLPGVGAFGDAMANLGSRGLVEVLDHEVIRGEKPFLGICLGLQLLAKSSQEHGQHAGLGWIDADVVRFDSADSGLKVPHMGWNDIEPVPEHFLFDRLRPVDMAFYFVHSFHIVCRDPGQVVATCDYGYPFAAVIAWDNIVATQFHPEKSQDNGLQVLRNFCSM